MEKQSLSRRPLAELGAYLTAQQNTLLQSWQQTCEQDPTLPTTVTLTQQEFTDRVPDLLTVLSQRLQAQDILLIPNREVPKFVSQVLADPILLAREHGLHRWQKGYTLQELMSEIAHLHQCIIHQAKQFWAEFPTPDPAILLEADQISTRLIHEAISGSVIQYHDLQKIGAAERAADLQQTLSELNELMRQRSHLLRMASHDLKGSFGVMRGAAYILDQPDNTEEERTEMVQMLQRNLSKVTTMLTQLMDLARLEAGQEILYTETFDAAKLLCRVAESLQPLADERNLSIDLIGPESLIVQSDGVKVQRIIQNLLLNALKYTSEGGVTLSWGAENDQWWHFRVQDTGPGLPQTATVTTKPSPSQGEGIGLHIVKRLCGLLNGKMDIDTQPGVGTSFRLTLPRYYKG